MKATTHTGMTSHNHTVIHHFHPIGNTIRYKKGHGKGVIGVLVVGATLTSHFWLNLLPLCHSATIRNFIKASDLQLIYERLHVQPKAFPCFLVLVSGYIVDWFLAPLPPPGEAADPQELIQAVLDKIVIYEK
jgi:hypothetical protein